jgi:hypothetical protein
MASWVMNREMEQTEQLSDHIPEELQIGAGSNRNDINSNQLSPAVKKLKYFQIKFFLITFRLLTLFTFDEDTERMSIKYS